MTTRSRATKYGYRHMQLREAALARDGYVCQTCGKEATEADHIVERAAGGTDTLDNYRASCKSCNARRGAIFGNKLRARARRHPYFP